MCTRYADRWAHYFIGFFGPMTYALGLCKATLGEYDEAIDLMDDALAKLAAINFHDITVGTASTWPLCCVDGRRR